MTHVFSLASLRGSPDAAGLVDHGLEALWGPLRDESHGGWWSAVDPDGPVARGKEAYGHAFVVLAASSATAAGRPGARALLDEALAVLDRFWDPEERMLVEEWDESFTELDPYRGLNSAMHGVEALLAAHDVTGSPAPLERASAIASRVVGIAAAHQWRLPEHFSPSWEPLLDYHLGEPAHPFRPYGGTVGHWLEWARLLVQLGATTGADLLAPATALFDSAVRDGWSADGTPGFVYTVDWDGRPVVRQRMHWVAAEAIAAAAALWRATGRQEYADLHAAWWAHVRSAFVDPEGGSWWHELDPSLRPASSTWDGKPDVYHAVQATLVPRLPAAPSLAVALAPDRPADAASLVVPVPPERVAAALADPDALVEVGPPQGMRARSVTVEPGRVVQEVDLVSPDPSSAGTMTTTWSVLPATEGARVEVMATDVPSGIDHAVHEAALASSLRRLATRLGRG